MDNIKDVIKIVVANLAERKPDLNKDIQAIWQKVACESQQHACVGDFRDGCLKVTVDSPARLFRLNFKKNQFLKELKKEIPEVNAITFKVGKLQ